MKFLFLLTTAFYFFTSCDNSKKIKKKIDDVSSTDTTCLKELKEAKKDIEIGKLVYCHYSGNIIFNELRSENELASLLKEYNIEYKNESSSCIVYEGQTEHCYCELMDEKIKDKYGDNFIDSLINQSDSIYVAENINDTFYYAKCDTRPNYPGDTIFHKDEFSEILQEDLERGIIYPKGYIERANNDSSAFADIHFIVDRIGNAEISGYWFLFDMKVNHKFKNYFENYFDKTIKKKGWTPATIRQQKVNSTMVMRFYFD